MRTASWCNYLSSASGGYCNKCCRWHDGSPSAATITFFQAKDPRCPQCMRVVIEPYVQGVEGRYHPQCVQPPGPEHSQPFGQGPKDPFYVSTTCTLDYPSPPPLTLSCEVERAGM